MISKPNPDPPSRAEVEESEQERRKTRRLQLMMDMALSILRQAPNLTLEEATGMVANCKSTALAMFPDKELAFDLIYKPRFERALAERFQESGDRA